MSFLFKHGDRPLEGVTIQRAVGRGGFGEVYYALTDAGKQVALKYLRDNPEIELRGISHVMNLKSPHLVTIYDVRRNAADEAFVIMEYISGPSLHELLSEPTGLGVQKTAYFLKGIAGGLAYLHERGIVHRDLKPANIFYDDGYVKIGDYGLSKHLSISRHSGQTVSVGTVHYMAPEVGSGSYTKAIDIYALGVITYEMLTGRLPFTGASMAEILMRHLNDTADTSSLPAPFGRVIAKALAKNPAERYQDVNQMVDDVMSSVEVSQSVSSFDPLSLTRTRGAIAAPTVTHAPKPPDPPALDVRAADEFTPGHRLAEAGERLSRRLQERVQRWKSDASQRGNQPRMARLATLACIALGVSVGLAVLTRASRPELFAAYLLYQAGGVAGSLLAHFQIVRRNPSAGGAYHRLATAGLSLASMLPAVLASDNYRPAERLIFPLAITIALCDWNRRIVAGRQGQVDTTEAISPAIVGLIAGGFADAHAVIAAALAASTSLFTQAAAGAWPLTAEPRRGREAELPPIPPVPHPTPPAEPSPAQSTDRSAPDRLTSDGAAVTASVESASLPRHSWLRKVLFGAGATICAFLCLGCFFALVTVPHLGEEGAAALLFSTLAGGVWMLFCLLKLRQRTPQTLWNGTLRWVIAALGLTLTSAMICVLSFSRMHADEQVLATIFLVGGGVVAVVCMAARTNDEVAPPAPTLPAGPSFVGRTATAGLALLAKGVFLIGLTGAMTFAHVPWSFEGGGHRWRLLNGQLERYAQEGEMKPVGTLPRAAPLALLVLGGLLVVFSRRYDGAHLLRGALGAGAGITAAVLVLGPASDALGVLLSSRDWEEFGRLDEDSVIALIFAAALAVTSVALLFWPRSSPNRPIVV